MAGFYKYIMSSSFVCPTEILELNGAMPQFKKLDCEVLACSTDSHFSHHSWSAIMCSCLLVSLKVSNMILCIFSLLFQSSAVKGGLSSHGVLC